MFNIVFSILFLICILILHKTFPPYINNLKTKLQNKLQDFINNTSQKIDSSIQESVQQNMQQINKTIQENINNLEERINNKITIINTKMDQILYKLNV